MSKKPRLTMSDICIEASQQQGWAAMLCAGPKGRDITYYANGISIEMHRKGKHVTVTKDHGCLNVPIKGKGVLRITTKQWDEGAYDLFEEIVDHYFDGDWEAAKAGSGSGPLTSLVKAFGDAAAHMVTDLGIDVDALFDALRHRE